MFVKKIIEKKDLKDFESKKVFSYSKGYSYQRKLNVPDENADVSHPIHFKVFA